MLRKIKKISEVAVYRLRRLGLSLRVRWLRLLGTSSYDSQVAEESRHWSGTGDNEAPLTWQDHPYIAARINARISGNTKMNWVEHFALTHGRRGFDKGLNLGCGTGRLEQHALALSLVRYFDSYEISEPAIRYARSQPWAGRVNFHQGDLNRTVFETDAYEVAFASSALHHLPALEQVLTAVRAALRPRGYFVCNEFMGPARFQWTERQLEIINLILEALPERYRNNLRGRGIKRRVYRPRLDETSLDSPFEAVCSDRILPALAARFEIKEQNDFGGAVLHQLLDGIAGNFDAENAVDRAWLDVLVELDWALMEAGEVQSDFTFIVAAKSGE